MPMSDRVSDKASSFKGLRSGFPIESYGIDSASEIKNFVLKDNQLRKQPGSEAYISASNSAGEHLVIYGGGISSIHRFKKLWSIQRGTALGVETEEEGKGFTVVNQDDLLSSSAKLFSASWRDRLFVTNGVDTNFLFSPGSGTALANDYKYGRLGLDAPPKDDDYFQVGPSGDAGNVDIGNHYYLFTLFDEKTNTESPAYGACLSVDGLYELSPNGELGPSPFLVTVSASAQRVIFTGTNYLISYLTFYRDQHFPRATHFIMYRSGDKVDGLYNSFFRVPLKNGGSQDGSLFINIDDFVADGDDFVDNTADADLTTVSLPENNSPPPTPRRATLANAAAVARSITSDTISSSDCSGFRHMRVFRDQLFGIGAKAPGYTVTEVTIGSEAQKVRGLINDFSDILYGSEVYQPDYFTYLWEVGRGDGQESIGLGVLGDVALLCFKERSTHYLSGSSPSDYVLRIMDTQRGAIHESTIQETSAGVITLDRSGFVLWNKIGQGEDISNSIQDVIDRISFENSDVFYSYYNPKEQQYVCAVIVDGGTTPNLTLTLDLKTMEWSSSSGVEGLCRSCDLTSNGVLRDLLGSATNGRLLNLGNEQNVTFQGTPIEAIWTSGTINFGDDQRKKKMQWIYLRAKSASSWKVNIEVIPDYDESRKFVVEDWDVVSSQSTWYSSDVATDGNLIWEEGTWASDGKVRQVSKIPIKCIGYTFQVRIINRESDADRYGFTIESVSCEAVKFGR